MRIDYIGGLNTTADMNWDAHLDPRFRNILDIRQLCKDECLEAIRSVHIKPVPVTTFDNPITLHIRDSPSARRDAICQKNMVRGLKCIQTGDFSNAVSRLKEIIAMDSQQSKKYMVVQCYSVLMSLYEKTRNNKEWLAVANEYLKLTQGGDDYEKARILKREIKLLNDTDQTNRAKSLQQELDALVMKNADRFRLADYENERFAGESMARECARVCMQGVYHNKGRWSCQ